MSYARWFRLASLAAILTACAHSSSIDDSALDDDDDAGLVQGGDDAGGNGSQDGAADARPGDSGDGAAKDAGDASLDGPGDDDGPCQGVVCDSPPVDSCEGNGLRAHASIGTCEDGECSYASTLETCSWGCEGSSCKPDPCAGKTCNNAPANKCADANDLRVYEQVGTCNSAGECSYGYSDQHCEKGCKAGACVDDLCAGVSCNSPPEPKCEDESTLKVFRQHGACNGSTGECAYDWDPSFCQFGCVGDRCKDDPCAGILCTARPANRCSAQDAKILLRYDADGKCLPVGSDSHTCEYPEPTEVYCEFGCVNGACKDDPCAGKTCNTPPARDCKNANTARVYAATGTCSGGICSHQATEIPCPYGCVNGVCKNCTDQAGCGAGEWCNNDSCASCDNDFHCGASCVSCAASGKKCHQGSCVECTSDGQCGSGRRCENNTCVTCNTSGHCGASCSPCSGNRPVCDGTQCICDATSCGPGATCSGASCVTCNTVASCGPSCDTCSGATPVCGGATVGCVCTESSCGAGNYCGSNGACASCGPAACGNGRCDCGETSDTCPSDCGPPCPTGLVIGDWTSGDDGWVYDKQTDVTKIFWKNYSGYIGGGSGTGNTFTKDYTRDLAYDRDVNLSMCTSATLNFDVRLSQDTSTSSGNNRERLNVQCSGDGGSSWIDMTPNPWPSKQGGCSPSYCTGTYTTDQSFNWTAQSITLPAACRTARARVRFHATGKNAWTMFNPGWAVRNVKVN